MTKTSGLAEPRAPFASSVVSVHGNPGADGRLMIPAALRDAAGIKRGDKVNLRVEDGQIVVTGVKAELRKLNGMFAHFKGRAKVWWMSFLPGDLRCGAKWSDRS